MESQVSNADHHTMEEVKRKMKEDVIQLLISLHSSSRSCNNNPSDSTTTAFNGSNLRIEKLKTLIQKHLPSLLTTNFITPTHPPYAVMVMEAIKDLDEEGGSNVDSISSYIESNFEDLPWAHSHLLNHHLNKLVDMGEIVLSSNSCYSLFQNPNPNPKTKKQQRRKGRRLCGRPPKIQGSGEDEKTDLVQSSFSSNEDDDLNVLGDGNRSTAVIEGDPVLEQLPTSPILTKKSDPPPVEERTDPPPAEEKSDPPPVEEIDPPPMEEHPTIGIDVGPKIMSSGDVDDNPTVGIEAGPKNITSGDIDDNPKVGIEVEPTGKQYRRSGRRLKKRGEATKESCGGDGLSKTLVIDHPTVGTEVGPEWITCYGVDNNPTVGIEVGSAEKPQEEPVKRKRGRQPTKLNTNEVKKPCGGSTNLIIDHPTIEIKEGSEPIKSSGDDNNPTVNIEVGPADQQPVKRLRVRQPKKLDTNEVQKSCGGSTVLIIALPTPTVAGSVRKKSSGVNDNPTVGIEMGPTEEQLQQEPVKRRRGRQPKKLETDEIKKSCDHPTVEIGLESEPIRSNGVDDNPTVGVEVGPTEPMKRKRRGRPKISDTDEVVKSCGEDELIVLANKHQTVDNEVGLSLQEKLKGKKRGRPCQNVDNSSGLEHQQTMSDASRSKVVPPKKKKRKSEKRGRGRPRKEVDGSMMVPPKKKERKYEKRGRPRKKVDPTEGIDGEPGTEVEPKQGEHQSGPPPPPAGPSAMEMNEEIGIEQEKCSEQKMDQNEEPGTKEEPKPGEHQPGPSPPAGPSSKEINEEHSKEMNEEQGMEQEQEQCSDQLGKEEEPKQCDKHQPPNGRRLRPRPPRPTPGPSRERPSKPKPTTNLPS